ncbi:MAG: ArnT family glycosyltransferase [Promethearchaeota archaeon]
MKFRLFMQEQFKILVVLLIPSTLAFILQVTAIGNYGLSQDEVLKALATQRYIRLDFTENAQHPALSKLLMTFSVLLFGETEFALRLPNTFIGALTVYPIFFLGKELYNDKTGFIACVLWAVHIPAISFTTTAKEDALVTFFWIWAFYFFIKAKNDPRQLRFTGMCVGLALSSKYSALILVGILFGLYFFKRYEGIELPSLKETSFLSIPPAVLTFLIFNFPILLPATIANVLDHYVPSTPAHTGYFMMGELFSIRPPYYLLLHILVKTPLSFLSLLLVGILFAIKDRLLSDKILLFWIILPLGFFSVTTYGYVRYYLVIIPAFTILAAKGLLQFSIRLIDQIKRIKEENRPRISITITVLICLLVCLHSLSVAVEVHPYYRMYVNELGGGLNKAGHYFPHDSVYDYLLREAIQYVSERAQQNSTVAMSVPLVGEYYGRKDLNFVYIRDLPENVSQWTTLSISYAIVQPSRTVFENQQHFDNIRDNLNVEEEYEIFQEVVAQVFRIPS